MWICLAGSGQAQTQSTKADPTSSAPTASQVNPLNSSNVGKDVLIYSPDRIQALPDLDKRTADSGVQFSAPIIILDGW